MGPKSTRAGAKDEMAEARDGRKHFPHFTGMTIQSYSATCGQAVTVDVLKSSERTEICGKYSAKPGSWEETSYIFHPLMSTDFSLVFNVRLLVIAQHVPLVSPFTVNCVVLNLHKNHPALSWWVFMSPRNSLSLGSDKTHLQCGIMV